MVTFKVLQLCNEGIFLLNEASEGFPLKGWYWFERVWERKRKRERLYGGWGGTDAGKEAESLSSFQGCVASDPPVKLH